MVCSESKQYFLKIVDNCLEMLKFLFSFILKKNQIIPKMCVAVTEAEGTLRIVVGIRA